MRIVSHKVSYGSLLLCFAFQVCYAWSTSSSASFCWFEGNRLKYYCVEKSNLQEKMKHIEGSCLMSLSQLFYILQKSVTLSNIFVLLLMSVSWKFWRRWNRSTPWSDRHLSSPDTPEAMISCGWLETGWLIRDSLLVWAPVEVTSRVFADYFCLFILS